MEEYKRIQRNLVMTGHIVDMYEDEVQLPEGHVAKWDLISHKGAAAVVPVLDDGRILMVRQYRNTVERMTLEVPAGGKDHSEETGYACAARELEEETGYKSEQLTLLTSIISTIAFCDERIDIFVAENLTPSVQNLDEDEFINVEAYTLDDLVEKVLNHEIEDAKTICAIMTYRVAKDIGRFS